MGILIDILKSGYEIIIKSFLSPEYYQKLRNNKIYSFSIILNATSNNYI